MSTPPPANTKGPLAKLPTCSILDSLLMQRVEHPERAAALDKLIRAKFEKKVAVMVLDMSGFSKLTQRFGIIHYLAMIRRMRRVVTPAVHRNHGVIIKFEADNCFAVFPKADDAVQASVEINHDLEVANLATPDESDVHVCVGLGYGPILLACDDMYGNELNLAAKLGEDVAEKGEIFLTASLKKALKKKVPLVEIPLTVSGVTMKSYKVK